MGETGSRDIGAATRRSGCLEVLRVAVHRALCETQPCGRARLCSRACHVFNDDKERPIEILALVALEAAQEACLQLADLTAHGTPLPGASAGQVRVEDAGIGGVP